MSTRLLSPLGEDHELCDDRESFWFILLFESLHFVKHNKPDAIYTVAIFDYVDAILTTGTHRWVGEKSPIHAWSGAGQVHFYGGPEDVRLLQFWECVYSNQATPEGLLNFGKALSVNQLRAIRSFHLRAFPMYQPDNHVNSGQVDSRTPSSPWRSPRTFGYAHLVVRGLPCWAD